MILTETKKERSLLVTPVLKES